MSTTRVAHAADRFTNSESGRRALTSPRLEQLLQHRAAVDLEISRERAFLEREARLKAEARRLADGQQSQAKHERLVAAVADAFVVTPDQLRSDSREPHLVEARWVAAWLLSQEGLSSPAIGRLINRDHSTVLHAIKQVESSADLQEIAASSRPTSGGHLGKVADHAADLRPRSRAAAQKLAQEHSEAHHEALVAAVAESFGATAAEIRDHRRTAHLVEARQVAAWALHQEDLSPGQIGRVLQRDRTTILYSLRRVAESTRLQRIATSTREAIGSAA